MLRTILCTLIVASFALNVAAASTVARAERIVVVIKLVILVLFVAVGISASRHRGWRQGSGVLRCRSWPAG